MRLLIILMLMLFFCSAQAKVICARPSSAGDDGSEASSPNPVCEPNATNSASAAGNRDVNVGQTVWTVTSIDGEAEPPATSIEGDTGPGTGAEQ